MAATASSRRATSRGGLAGAARRCSATRDRLTGAAAHHAARCRGAVEPLSPALLDGAGLVIDAIFGAGLARPIDGVAHAVIEALGASRIPVAAVDVPSGVDGATGEVRGAAPRADLTVTFFRKKPGHLLLSRARALRHDACSPISAFPTAVLGDIAPRSFENGPPLWLGALSLAAPTIINIAAAMSSSAAGAVLTGAARLAARAAARIGAGLVTVAAPQAAWPVYAASLTRHHRAADARAPRISRRSSPMSAARHAGRARRRRHAGNACARPWRRSARGARSCSTPTRSPSSPNATDDAVRRDQGADRADAA